MFWFFLFFMWIWLVISVFGDIIRASDLSGWAKAIWSLAIIIVPYIGVFAYLIVRGDSMANRSIQDAEDRDEAFRSYVRDAAGGTNTVDQLAALAELKANGTIDDAEFVKAKAQILR
ncbi:MAG: SHOCT domain-containing protein [Actinomycetia bacterium]|nr:SHOCT domain-containing protein [Actinomycetes bacterium]